MRPVRVRDSDVLEGARVVVANKGPAYTAALSAAELLFLLAQRALSPQGAYEVPQVMGPMEEAPCTLAGPGNVNVRSLATEIVARVMACGYLPHTLGELAGGVSPEYALMLLACQAIGCDLPSADRLNLSIDAIPGVPAAIENVKEYEKWAIRDERYGYAAIRKHFRLQCWTLKPAFTAEEYDAGIKLGRHLNPMFARG